MLNEKQTINEEKLKKYRTNNNDIVFGKTWFEKHQIKLLLLANSWVGEYIFQFNKMGCKLDKSKKIVKITPFSVTQLNGLKGKGGKIKFEYKEYFLSTNEYSKKLYFALLPMWYAMHIWDWFMADHFKIAPQLSFGFSTLTQYPASIGSNNPIDGVVKREGAISETWSTIIAGAGTGNDINSALGVVTFATSTTNRFSGNRRSIICFDTSSLGISAVISSAVLSL